MRYPFLGSRRERLLWHVYASTQCAKEMGWVPVPLRVFFLLIVVVGLGSLGYQALSPLF